MINGLNGDPCMEVAPRPKKMGRVNPGAGIYDPPPPLENSRVNIVLNC